MSRTLLSGHSVNCPIRTLRTLFRLYIEPECPVPSVERKGTEIESMHAMWN